MHLNVCRASFLVAEPPGMRKAWILETIARAIGRAMAPFSGFSGKRAVWKSLVEIFDDRQRLRQERTLIGEQCWNRSLWVHALTTSSQRFRFSAVEAIASGTGRDDAFSVGAASSVRAPVGGVDLANSIAIAGGSCGLASQAHGAAASASTAVAFRSA
jgi:hypothetical protein